MSRKTYKRLVVAFMFLSLFSLLTAVFWVEHWVQFLAAAMIFFLAAVTASTALDNIRRDEEDMWL